jgi:large subunit ribosomal protein L10
MNRDQKSAVIDEIAASITNSSAIFAVDYRGITVEQARELRTRLREADATLRVVKNSLTERAADKAGVEQLKPLLEGPTALTFVRGDSALAAKSIADFARVTQLLAFKGGMMDGATVSPAEIATISRLPSRQVLYGQLTGLVATPITGLARTLNAMISGLAIGLAGVLDQKKASPEFAAAQSAEAALTPAPGNAEPEDAGEPAGIEEPPAEAQVETAAEEAAAPSPPTGETPPAEPPSEEPTEQASSEAQLDPQTEDSPQSGSTTDPE